MVSVPCAAFGRQQSVLGDVARSREERAELFVAHVCGGEEETAAIEVDGSQLGAVSAPDQTRQAVARCLFPRALKIGYDRGQVIGGVIKKGNVDI